MLCPGPAPAAKTCLRGLLPTFSRAPVLPTHPVPPLDVCLHATEQPGSRGLMGSMGVCEGRWARSTWASTILGWGSAEVVGGTHSAEPVRSWMEFRRYASTQCRRESTKRRNAADTKLRRLRWDRLEPIVDEALARAVPRRTHDAHDCPTLTGTPSGMKNDLEDPLRIGCDCTPLPHTISCWSTLRVC